MANIALILAGGTGTRFGSDMPKQFLKLQNGKEIVISTVDAFAYHHEIDKILIVCHKDYINVLESLLKKQNYAKDICVISGGETRRQSSFIGLCKLNEDCNSDDIVLIHDAARPFVNADIISENIACAKKYSACTTAIALQDTLLMSKDGNIATKIVDRSLMYAVQTPQTFRLSLILEAHKQSGDGIFTDDSGLLLSQNRSVHMVIGDKRNLKITSAEDIDIANSFI